MVRSLAGLSKVAELLASFDKPWFVAGGWAVDLFLGCVTRDHKDTEIAILRRDQLTLQSYLKGWEFNKVIPATNVGIEPWDRGEWLELPVHEIHAQRADSDLSELEILLNESSGEKWRFRRNLEIVRPLALFGLHSKMGIPFLGPEIVLLFKAKNPTTDDEADFNNLRHVLDRERQGWLRQAIEACYPGHAWLAYLLR